MNRGNESQVTEVTLLGFSYHPNVKMLLFVTFILVYLVNLTANGLFITVTVADSRLHSPMYFFLCNLSLLDLCFSSVSVPTVLKGFLVQLVTLRLSLCLTQMYFGLVFGQSECFLLAVMAWDRYVAICHPLSYRRIMTNGVCVYLAVCVWALGAIFALFSLGIVSVLQFCGRNIINHTVCEADALSRMTCRNSWLLELSAPVMSLFTLVAPVSLILFTYCRIIASILRMPTEESRRRTFATCGSHLMVVTLFYGTAMVIYLGPKSTSTSEKDKSFSLFYELVVPALNPLIYTLRNKEVKGAIRKLCPVSVSSHKTWA